MENEKVIVFDIWGRYAHFKKIYVTTSALTYAIPFKTTIYGLVGAIIGLENEQNEYLNNFSEDNCKLAIQVINSINFQRINTNLSQKPGSVKGNRKPTTMEYVVDPYYRIYFWHKDIEIYNKLKIKLEKKESVFTPVLGLAHCIANFIFKGEYEIRKHSGNALIDSVILKSQLKSLDSSSWNDHQMHIQEQSMYPLEMNTAREVIKRDNIIFDLTGNPIQCEVDEYYTVKTGKISSNIVLM